jgi:hypothetical protein
VLEPWFQAKFHCPADVPVVRAVKIRALPSLVAKKSFGASALTSTCLTASLITVLRSATVASIVKPLKFSADPPSGLVRV